TWPSSESTTGATTRHCGSDGLDGCRGRQVLLQGQAAHSAPAGGEDRVRERRSDRRHGRFAESARGGRARDEVHVDARRFVDPQKTVVAEALLLRNTVLHGDLAEQ